MDSPVYNEGYSLAEGLSAGVAGVGFLSGVDALVIVQRGEFLEAATALVATVRSFIAMIEHVFVVGLLERERFRTQIAAVWCLSCVEAGVFAQILFGGEEFVTDVTFPFLGFVGTNMLL